LEIKSRFKQTIQNITSRQNQKQNAIHLSVDCWIQASASEETAAILVDVWFKNAISNHGPNSHKSICVSLLAARAKSRSEVQRHVKFIVELVSEEAQNALNTLQTFAEGDQAAPQNANLQTTSGFRQGAMSIFTTIISAG
jgi:hypothetical protein